MRTKQQWIEYLREDVSKIIVLPFSFRDNKDFILELVETLTETKFYAHFLSLLSDELKNDKDIVSKIIGIDPYAIRYASDRLKDDEEILIKAMSKDPSLIDNASPRLRVDKELSLICLKHEKGSFGHLAYTLIEKLVKKGIVEKDEAIKYLEALILKEQLKDELSENEFKSKKSKI
jgi:hypothetical protein